MSKSKLFRRVSAIAMSLVMTSSMCYGFSFRSTTANAASVAVPSWASSRVYFHTVGNDTTDAEAWAVMETNSGNTNKCPYIGDYNSASSFRVYLPTCAKNSDNTYLVYNNYSSSITIGGTTINAKQTGYVSSNNISSIKLGSKSCGLTVYSSNAESNVFFTTNQDTKNKSGNTLSGSTDFTRALGLDGSKSSKTSAVVTSPQITVTQANGKIDTSALGKQIKGRGNTTWKNTLKKSWNFTLTESTSLAGMPKGKKYSLLANFQDPSLSRNRLIYDLADSVGVKYASDSRYADVYVQGLYIGSYQLAQKADSLPKLADMQYNADGSVKSGDFMIELACASQNDDFEIGLNSGIISVVLPDEYTTEQKTAIRNYIKSKYNKLFDIISNTNCSKKDLSAVADVSSIAKSFLLQELSKNFDAGVSSYYLCYIDDKFYVAPVWDFDNSLGNCNTSPVSDYKSTSGWWCKNWKGNGGSYSGNFVHVASRNKVVLAEAKKAWFGSSIDDTTSFVYNINKFATNTSSSATLTKNTGLLTKNYYLKASKSSATSNFSKWTLVPNSWVSNHNSVNYYTINYNKLYKYLDTTTCNTLYSTSVNLSSYYRNYHQSKYTSSSDAGGQYEYAADYMVSRAAWLSYNLIDKKTSSPMPTVTPTATPTTSPVVTSTPTAPVVSSAPTSSPVVTSTPTQNAVTIYYKRAENTSWTTAYAHFKTDSVGWTTAPGQQMQQVAKNIWMITINLNNATTTTICFNNGSGAWDNNNKQNYILKKGSYTIDQPNGTITPNPVVATATPVVTEVDKTKAVVYFKNTTWENAYCHYKVNGTWTTLPGVKMTKIENVTIFNNTYNWKLEIDLQGADHATVCFTDGNNRWDSRNGLNYSVYPGANGILNSKASKL